LERATVGDQPRSTEPIEQRISRLESTIARLDTKNAGGGRRRRAGSAGASRSPRPQRPVSPRATPMALRSPRTPPAGGYHFFRTASRRRGDEERWRPYAPPRMQRRRMFAESETQVTLSKSQGWGFGEGGGAVDHYNTRATRTGFGRSATEVRKDMRKHQHASPRPQRMNAEGSFVSMSSQKGLARQKRNGLRPIDKASGQLEGPSRTPSRTGGQIPSSDIEGWSGDASRSQRTLAKEKSLMRVSQSVWDSGSHAKTVDREGRGYDGLHKSCAELRRQRGQHSTDLHASHEWHGDGRHLSAVPFSHQRIRAQINLCSAPTRPGEHDKLSPQRNREMKVDDNARGYSQQALRAAKSHHRHEILSPRNQLQL